MLKFMGLALLNFMELFNKRIQDKEPCMPPVISIMGLHGTPRD
jgi:hypothetical protein